MYTQTASDIHSRRKHSFKLSSSLSDILKTASTWKTEVLNETFISLILNFAGPSERKFDVFHSLGICKIKL